MKTLTIAADGSGDFSSLTDAAAACAARPGEPVRFLLRRGIYRERPVLELDDYLIEGEDRSAVVLTADTAGRDPWPGEEKTGTFRSQTLFLGGGFARLANLTVQNTAGDGALRGQALAVYADADRVQMENVNLYGNQDTLFTAPLPLREREKNGFRGPRQNTPRRPTRQYYRNCAISGNIDFIFGGADAVFDGCTLLPLPCRAGVAYITAASTPAGQDGYLFAGCTVQGHCPAGSVYLGRPWRGDASVFWLDCTLSGEIAPAGWDNWNNPANEQTARFGEWGSTGPGAAAQRAFGSVNDAAAAERARARLRAFRAEFVSLAEIGP